MTRATIIGTGMYVPSRVVTNEDLAARMETTDEWITERSGIKERRWLETDADGWTIETGSEMGAAAARQAIEAAGIETESIDQIIYATLNPDCFFPGNGVFIEDLLGLRNAGAMDIRNQCTGFIYGLAAADGFIRAGTAETVLVIGGEVQSTALDVSDRGRDMAVLFGDGAGAAVVQATEGERGILASVLHSQGRFAKDLWCEAPVGNRMERITPEMIKETRHYPKMDGRLVFKHATRRFCEAITEVLAKGGMNIEDLNLLIPHQANQRITDAVGQRMGLPPERVFSNIARYGNTTAATIPIAMAEAERQGRLKQGDIVVTVAFGSGFTWGANLIRW
ncbi:MAG: ketoacyl-ACP synthase III [Gemmatimonadales bacterium]|nr:ketoacyl-ACP synthase III [Gemmatimonadales bacterium]